MLEETAPVTETAPAETAPVSTAPVTEMPAVDPFDDAQVQSFDRTYVQKLREEAASRRTALKPYEEAFAPYSDAERQVWFGLATELVSSPKTAADKLEQIVKEIRGVDSTVEQTKETPAGDAKATYLTQEDVNRMLAERDQQADLEKLTHQIVSEAETLGYKQGTPEYQHLLSVAQSQTNGDLNKAHEAVKAYRQAAVDAYIAEKSGQGGVRLPAPGNTASQTQPIKNYGDARAAMEAFLQAQ